MVLGFSPNSLWKFPQPQARPRGKEWEEPWAATCLLLLATRFGPNPDG